MRRRFEMKNKRSKAIFTNTASRTHKKNTQTPSAVMRGGIRL
jgi:hypothetical protein